MKKILLITLLSLSLQLYADALSWLNPAGYDIGLEGNSTDYAIRQPSKISANGRYVSFLSGSSNLVVDTITPRTESYDKADIYVKDLQTGEIKTASLRSNGYQVDASFNPFTKVSDNGEIIAFTSRDPSLPLYESGQATLYIKNIVTGEIHTPQYNGLGVEVYDGASVPLYLSKNGDKVYFTSRDQLVANDTNISHSGSDVYVYHVDTQVFELISIDSNGQAAGGSDLHYVSANEKYISFVSVFDVLPIVSGTAGNSGFIRDIEFNTTTVFSLDNDGNPFTFDSNFSVVSNNGLVYYCSGNEDLVASDNNLFEDIFVYNNGNVSLFPFPNGTISDLGCYTFVPIIAVNEDDTEFYIWHTSNQIDTSISSLSGFKLINVNLTTNQTKIINLVAGDVFEFNYEGFSTSDSLSDLTLVSHTTLGRADIQSNNQKTFHYNSNSDEFDIVPTAAYSPVIQNKSIINASISDDQNWLVYETNADNVLAGSSALDGISLYLVDRNTSTTTKIGYQVSYSYYGGADISADGRYIAFTSSYLQGNLNLPIGSSYLFLLDRVTGVYTQIAENALNPKVNNDGNIVFHSSNSTLVANDNNTVEDVFLYERSTFSFTRISVNTSGGDANDESHFADIGGSGSSTWITYQSEATNLIASDVNDSADIFLINWPIGTTKRISELTGTGVGGDNNSTLPRISTNTSVVTFLSYSPNLAGVIDFTKQQVYAYDRNLNTLDVISRDMAGNLIDESSGTDKTIVSSDGRYIAFETRAELLGAAFPEVNYIIYVYDRQLDVMKKMTQYPNGQNFERTRDVDNGFLLDFAVDSSQSNPLLGVVFPSKNFLNNTFLGLDQQLNRVRQLYLMQSGGDGENLNVKVDGLGTVTGNLGFNCTDDCDKIYSLGQDVFLVATPTNPETFMFWRGGPCDNSTEQTCTVYMNSDKSVQAVFTGGDIIFANGFE